MNPALFVADLCKLAVSNGNWVTPASDSTAASPFVKQALDLFAQPSPSLTLFGHVVFMQVFPADATADHHEVLASTDQIE